MKNQSHNTNLVQFHKINAKNYQNVWDFQSLLHEKIKADKFDRKEQLLIRQGKKKSISHLIFCEHAPVFTLGKSADEAHLLFSEDELHNKGFEVYSINRGGDVTYHGPGQLTAYFIMDVELLKRDVHLFVRNLEEVVISVLKLYKIEGERVEGLTGVWVKNDSGFEKICAIGVHLSRWVSMHGLAFNIDTQLNHFDNIIPCGIRDDDKSVTSLGKLLGREIGVDEVIADMKTAFQEVFNFQFIN